MIQVYVHDLNDSDDNNMDEDKDSDINEYDDVVLFMVLVYYNIDFIYVSFIIYLQQLHL